MRIRSRLVVFRPIIFDGADSDFMYFRCNSWSRENLIHNIVIDKREGIISCTCEAGVMRKMKGDMNDLEAKTGCRHINKLCFSMKRMIDENIEVAQNA